MQDKITHYQELTKESKNIFLEREEIKGTLKEALPSFEKEKTERQEAIVFALSHRTPDQITEEQRAARVAITANFRANNQELITKLKELSTQNKTIRDTKNQYNEEIGEIYLLLKERGLLKLNEQQFKRTLFIEKQEFGRLFEKDVLLQSLSDLTEYTRRYIDILWDDFYHKGESCGENFGMKLGRLIQLIEKIIGGYTIDDFNDGGFNQIIDNMDVHQRQFFETILFEHYDPEYDWLGTLLLEGKKNSTENA